MKGNSGGNFGKKGNSGPVPVVFHELKFRSGPVPAVFRKLNFRSGPVPVTFHLLINLSKL